MFKTLSFNIITVLTITEENYYQPHHFAGMSIKFTCSREFVSRCAHSEYGSQAKCLHNHDTKCCSTHFNLSCHNTSSVGIAIIFTSSNLYLHLNVHIHQNEKWYTNIIEYDYKQFFQYMLWNFTHVILFSDALCYTCK